MIKAIENFFLNILGRHLCVLICSMIPIIELRGSIPLGAGLGLPFWLNYLLSVVGNMIPVPFILLFIGAIIRWMKKVKHPAFLSKFALWLERKVEKNRHKIEKYSFWGLFLLVAIPLPGTGAWTGSLVAGVIGVKFPKAVLAVALGVMTAGVIMTLISYGVLGFMSFLL